MNIKLFKISFRTFIILLVISLAFIGSDCNKIIEVIGGNNADLTGNWKLIYNSGTLNDVCPGETIDFQTNGIAIIACPGNGQSIERNYTNSGNVLTYTLTGIKYDIKTLTSTDLELQGVNNDRYLYYTRVTTSEKPGVSENTDKSKINNSSEK
jgi:hypothetical protein